MGLGSRYNLPKEYMAFCPSYNLPKSDPAISPLH